MLHKKRDEEAVFQKKLAVTEYINLLPEIFLEDKNYVIWAYEDAADMKDSKLWDADTASGTVEEKEFPKYYICNKARPFCKRCGQQLSFNDIFRTGHSDIKHFRRIMRQGREYFEPVLLELTWHSWRCRACYDPSVKPQYMTTEDDNSSLLGACNRKITKDCKEFIATRALYMEQNALKDIFKIDIKTISGLLEDKINELDRERRWDNIQKLEIYTIRINRRNKEYCLCTNLDTETFIEWFPWDNHAMEKNFVEKLQLCQHNIKKIVTSIDFKACKFAQTHFPQIERQIDRVDVKDRLLKAMQDIYQKVTSRRPDMIYKMLQRDLPLFNRNRPDMTDKQLGTIDDICEQYPAIDCAYYLKEDGYNICRWPKGQANLVDGWIGRNKSNFQLFKQLEKRMKVNRDEVISFAEHYYGIRRDTYEKYLIGAREPLDKYLTLNIEDTMTETARRVEQEKSKYQVTDENGTAPRTLKKELEMSVRSKAGTRFNEKTARGMILYGIAMLYNAKKTEDMISKELRQHKIEMMSFMNNPFAEDDIKSYITLHNFGIPLEKLGEYVDRSIEFKRVLSDVGMEDYWHCARRENVLSSIGSPEKIQWVRIASNRGDNYSCRKTGNYPSEIFLGSPSEWWYSCFDTDGLLGVPDKYDTGYDVPNELAFRRPKENYSIMVMRHPFCERRIYLEDKEDKRLAQWRRFFPTEEHENLVICTSVDENKEVNVLMTSRPPIKGFLQDARCFPLYVYDEVEKEEDGQLSFSDVIPEEKTTWVRRSMITDKVLALFKDAYGSEVSQEDIFYYIYAVLHSPQFRENVKDIKMSRNGLKIPMLEYFSAYVRIGRALADVHLNYRKHIRQEELGIVVDGHEWHFGMNKSIIEYNPDITIRNIPKRAYDYTIGGKSPVEWVMDQHVVAFDNKKCNVNEKKYVLQDAIEPLMSAVSVSLRTQTLIEQLP